MLSASLPPERYKTTRFRLFAPCARARSQRKSGAAKVTVNAAAPLVTNCRLVIFMTGSHELVLGRPRDQVNERGRLCQQLRVASGPRAGRAEVARQLAADAAVDRRGGQLLKEERHQRLGRRAVSFR